MRSVAVLGKATFINALVVGFMLLGARDASAYCMQPFAPACSTTVSPFLDAHAVRSCEMRMDEYRRQVDEYTECQRRESNGKIGTYDAFMSKKQQIDDATNDFERRKAKR